MSVDEPEIEKDDVEAHAQESEPPVEERDDDPDDDVVAHGGKGW